jgi:hypothetical protein
MSEIGLKTKRHGIKKFVANLMNQISCTLDATIALG